jgi:amino acid transporter
MNEQNMSKKSLLITACMSMGFMISPLSLGVLGNSAGLMGQWLLWILPFIAMINLWTASIYTRFTPGFHPSGFLKSKDSAVNSKGILTILQLASLIPFCIGACTLILAMAGYAFNEIFLFWFPNLLFSICVLILVVTLNLVGSSISRSFQSLSVLIFLGSMLLLLILGIFNWEKPVFQTQNIPFMIPIDWRPVVLVFWLFMAAELSLYHDEVYQNVRAQPFSLLLAFFGSSAIFWLWGLASLNFASLERLAESTVPHSIVARAISEENGRKIMGVTILTGSLASVNTLLAGVTAVMVSMAKSRQIFSILNRKIFGGNAAMIFLFIGILCMLLTGMAGKEITNTLTNSGFYIWLISYASFNLFALWQLPHSPRIKNKALMSAGFLTAIIYMVGAVVLIATDPDWLMVIAFLVSFFVLSIITVVFSRYYYGLSGSKQRN